MICKQGLQVQTMGEDVALKIETKGPFEGILGNTIELRVIEHLLCLPSKDFNISELARSAGVSRPAADRVAKKFARWGIVEALPKRGNMIFYRLNEKSHFVISIHSFNESASMALCTKFSDTIRTSQSTRAIPPQQMRTRRIRKLKAYPQQVAVRIESKPAINTTLASEIDEEAAKALNSQSIGGTYKSESSNL